MYNSCWGQYIKNYLNLVYNLFLYYRIFHFQMNNFQSTGNIASLNLIDNRILEEVKNTNHTILRLMNLMTHTCTIVCTAGFINEGIGALFL